MNRWEARQRVIQAALSLASTQADPFGETRDPNHDAAIELGEDMLDDAIQKYESINVDETIEAYQKEKEQEERTDAHRELDHP